MDPTVTPADLAALTQELAARIGRHAPCDGLHETAVPDLRFRRSSRASEPMHTVYAPSLCIIVQGAKSASLGEEIYRYDPASYLVTSVHLPVLAKVMEATPQVPYLSLQLNFSPDAILDLAQETARPESSPPGTGRGISVTPSTPPLLEAVLRLVKLLDTPEDIPVLAPLAHREILYRVLQGGQGALIRQIAAAGSQANLISKAIRLLHRDYDKPLHIEELAREIRMSPSALFKHFKKVTAMSPLQYQKAIRLQEARRLLLTETVEAADAGYRVGYESPSQFSREYARMFGRPPISDVRHLRETVLPTLSPTS
ncbi:AraC family transcriptional regulator [Paenibacillus caseinilyticus]|uniref:AraC family transcriptional regulator n=1 Tax=Paenibacillus mucilaginosus K02 TaxID=997761 RepID=I0BLC5_9BACL|nr:AraC family transcriptional regulator [Paenibacillus mucilaginosus]AFH63172.2 AraC family transcriptional regulator [Paenibacillus mucilaginosus K02]